VRHKSTVGEDKLDLAPDKRVEVTSPAINALAAGQTHESRFILGGGFYTGWPVRLELDQPSAEAPLHYRRIL